MESRESILEDSRKDNLTERSKCKINYHKTKQNKTKSISNSRNYK